MKKLIKIQILSLVLLIILSGCEFLPDNNTPDESTLPSDFENCSAHIDDDDNGLCDICQGSLFVYIDFYAINDLHGKFTDTSSNIGVDELTTYLKNRYILDDNVVLLSSGDMWQGSSESNLTQGQIITEWMNYLDFASMTLGNHEYDWGEEYIEINDKIAEFPFLAINIYDRDTNERADYCQASTVVEYDGIQIGIIGAVGDCYSSISGEKSEEVYFKTGSELTSLVKKESERLRSDGVDLIVYSIHDGYEQSNKKDTNISSQNLAGYYNTVLSDGYIDLVFEAHTHQSYILTDEYGVKHLQGGGENKGISHVEIKINSVNNKSSITVAEYVHASSYADLNDDPIVTDLMQKYEEMISTADEVLGNNERKRYSNEIKSLVAELYYNKGIERWGKEYDITLGGGFISARSPYDLKAGEIKYRDIQSILPFDNQLVLCSVRGEDLLNKFIYTDNKNYYIYMNGSAENIDKNATYYIVTDKYTSTYSWNRLTEIEEYDADVFARDLLAEYIKNGGWTSK